VRVRVPPRAPLLRNLHRAIAQVCYDRFAPANVLLMIESGSSDWLAVGDVAFARNAEMNWLGSVLEPLLVELPAVPLESDGLDSTW
jgi:hypothetical protein